MEDSGWVKQWWKERPFKRQCYFRESSPVSVMVTSVQSFQVAALEVTGTDVEVELGALATALDNQSSHTNVEVEAEVV